MQRVRPLEQPFQFRERKCLRPFRPGDELAHMPVCIRMKRGGEEAELPCRRRIRHDKDVVASHLPEQARRIGAAPHGDRLPFIIVVGAEIDLTRGMRELTDAVGRHTDVDGAVKVLHT
ncbi:hypothetical protein M1B78_18460, partial [Bacteroides sp. KH569_7]